MVAIVVANSRTGDEMPLAPTRDDHTPLTFEMLFNGRSQRAYADTYTDLVDALIFGYLDMTDQERLEARLDYALRVQVFLQATINGLYDLSDLTEEEHALLTGSRETPPEILVWEPEVPIVLVDAYYAPYSETRRTASGIIDVTYPPNIVWLSPLTEEDLLLSLHAAGWVDVREYMGDLA